MAVWADVDEDDEPSDFIHNQLTAHHDHEYRDRLSGDSSQPGVEVKDVSAIYIAHAMRCYPYA